ncbi:MAG: cadherin domain-containing protein, partial [Planctomycetaceae bacterium]
FQANDGTTGAELWKALETFSWSLSASSIAENQASGTSVGTFSTNDPDAGDTFTYTLVSGTGSTDNASFTIDGSTLKTAASFDFETKSSYSIRVRTTDQGGLSYEKQFTIRVLNVNEAATQITLSNVVSVLLANANTSSAIRLADVSITDDGLGTNTFNVSGADASVFEVVAGQLRLKAGTVLNYATKKTYSVTVNVDDTTVGGTPDASVNYTLSLQPLEGTTVQNGSVGRSYVRYVSLNFVVTQGLAEAVASVGTANSRIRLFFGGTTGTQSVAKTLTAGMVSLVGSQVKFDFGTPGVGGNAGTSLGDGIYRLRVDLDGDGLAEITGTFFRLFGDVDGNGLV